MNSKPATLSELLHNVDMYPWNQSLYTDKNTTGINGEMKVYVFNPDDADESKYEYLLQFATVQDIVANVKQQKLHPRDEDFIKAFQYYYKNDAFIKFE